MANRSKKDLKDRLLFMDMFESNLRILEFEIIRQLNIATRRYKRNLFNQVQNMKILEDISKRWVNNENFFFANNNKNVNEKTPRLFVLVGPKKVDKFTNALLRRLSDLVEREVKTTDYVITIGESTNSIALSHNLTVVAHFTSTILNDSIDFLEKISSVIRILTAKGLVSTTHLLYAETEIGTSGLMLQREILPINLDNWYSNLQKEYAIEQIAEFDVEVAAILNSSSTGETIWSPSIADINVYLIDLIIRLRISTVQNKNWMRYYEREYQLLQSKRDKIKEQKNLLLLEINKLRKEQITNDILMTSAAYNRTKLDEEENGVKNE